MAVAVAGIAAGVAAYRAFAARRGRRDSPASQEPPDIDRGVPFADNDPVRDETWFDTLLASSTDLICCFDALGRATWVSPAVTRILGYTPESRLGRSFADVIHPEDRDRVEHAFAVVAATPGEHGSVQCRMAHADGTWRHFESRATNMLADPSVGAIVTNSRDITDRVEATALIEHRALHDPLTGLANRRLLVDRLEQAVRRARRSGDPIGVLFIDLDRFKMINDRFGHSAGDRVLIVVAQRLVSSVRPGDTVARLGGDEFVIVADGASPGDAIGIAERVIGSLAEPIVLSSGETLLSSASIGVAMGGGRSSADGLLRDSDLALYRAKEAGRGRYEVFEPVLRQASVERLSTELLLRQALEQGDLVVLYEPVVDLATLVDIGAAARLGLQRASGELVGPQEFLAVAEESGLIVTIGAGVLDRACQQAMSWRISLGDRAPDRVAVDVSVRQLAHPSFLTQLGKVLGASGASPETIAIEVLEQPLRHAPASVVGVLDQIRALGIAVGLDGYGSESASLSSLAALPIDYVTLDTRLIERIDEDSTSRAITRAVIELAGSLGRMVVADGVNREEQLVVLREMGCSRGKGHYFGEPAEPAVLEHRLRERIPSNS